MSFAANAQDTIRAKMLPAKTYNWMILYQLKGVDQKYLANATSENGEFTLVVPKGSEPGMYRLFYDNTNNKFIDILYNNESIDVEFNPDYPEVIVKFNTSEENKLFQNYIDEVSTLENSLDSIQTIYFQPFDPKQKNIITEFYKKELDTYSKTQQRFEKKSNGKLVHHFIKASHRYFSDTLMKDVNLYMKQVKSHYYDYIDFNNKQILNSALIVNKIIDYIMYLNTSNDDVMTTKLRKEAVTSTLSKIDNLPLKKDIIESLLYLFAQGEKIDVVNYILKNHFEKLPVAYQDFEFKTLINDMLKTTVGFQAPDILWKDNGKQRSLYSLEKKSDYYIIAFWSSTCPHCLKEMPQLYKYLTDKPQITTLAVALETKESKAAWKEETFYYENFIHVVGMDKWKSTYSKDYGVTGTPSFFVLDKTKKIIAKPYDVKALKEFFDTILNTNDSK
jgi:thiol-disulfide isomerase/thioredoxin